jgi:hypothetical protein
MAAATQLNKVVAGRYHTATIAYLEGSHAEPMEWRQAALFGDTFLCVTAEELANLGREVDALMAPYTVGARPAGARPEGARHVTLIQVALPEGPAAGSPAQTP